jgi:hypothetical protein
MRLLPACAPCAGEAVRPEELANIGDSEKQETDKNMEEMWGVIKEQGDRCACGCTGGIKGQTLQASKLSWGVINGEGADQIELQGSLL